MDALIASSVCNYIDTPLSEAKNNDLERDLLELATSHRLASCRLQLTRTVICHASDSLVCRSLYEIWNSGTHPLLNENDYINMAYELALRYPDKYKEIIMKQRDRISNPDRKQQFDFISRAITPDTLEQNRLFQSLLLAENRSIEPWALKTLAYLCHPLRESQSIKYIRPALDALIEIQQTNDIFFPQSWVNTLLRERNTPEALREVEDFLNDNPDYPILLKNKILQSRWRLHQIVKNENTKEGSLLK
jgi:aminopeptidase N